MYTYRRECDDGPPVAIRNRVKRVSDEEFRVVNDDSEDQHDDEDEDAEHAEFLEGCLERQQEDLNAGVVPGEP